MLQKVAFMKLSFGLILIRQSRSVSGYAAKSFLLYAKMAVILLAGKTKVTKT